jgi:phosphate transport system protein
MSRHSHHFENQLETLRKMLLSIGALAEQSVDKSLKSLSGRDFDLAMEVIKSDERIDQAEVELEEECLKTLALYQPVATDLRLIVAILKMNNDLERIADMAVNLAERSIDLQKYGQFELPSTFKDMASKALWMLKASLDTFVGQDSKLAREICATDEDVDDALKEMYQIVQEEVRKNPNDIQKMLYILSASRYLERIADLATNIAEDVVYIVEGKIIRHRTEIDKPPTEE